MYLALIIFALLACTQASHGNPTAVAAVLVDERAPDFDRALVETAISSVEAGGYSIRRISDKQLQDADVLDRAKVDLLVLPGARSLSLGATKPIEKYLEAGGNLLALGLPAWQSATVEHDGKRISKAMYDATVARQTRDEPLLIFSEAAFTNWQHHCDEPNRKARYDIKNENGHTVLHVRTAYLPGWDTFSSPPVESPFPAGHTLTCFRARGTKKTTQLAIEWAERDGSRWIATIELTPEWKDYALTPQAFKLWPRPDETRSESEHLNVTNAVRFAIGIAKSHNQLAEGQHEYWVADIGTAKNPFGDFTVPKEIVIPYLESFAPSYQFFPMEGPLKISPPREWVVSGGDQAVDWPPKFPQLPGIHPRPQGAGFDQRRPWRWQPILEARSKTGDYRGAVGALIVNLSKPHRGGVWACFTPAGASFYKQPQIAEALRDTVSRIGRGLFLTEGGSEFFTTFEDQAFRLGANVVNFGSVNRANVSVRIRVVDSSHREYFNREWFCTLRANGEETFSQQWKVAAWPAGGFTVTTELLLDGKVIDRLTHELNVWKPKPDLHFIEARDGGFWLDGKQWKANGVNYMPSSGIGSANWYYFEHWIGRGAYDPTVIDRDLRRVKAMGLNAVSVFIYRESMEAQHLLDFLRRCEALGLHVNQSLRPGTPMNFRWQAMKELIEFYHMAQNDTIFAYDLAWEPAHHQEAYRETWPDWVLNKYGTVAAAEKAWGIAAPKVDNKETIGSPSMQQLTQDGEWRKMVADYRSFLDATLAQHYAEARRLVKSIDPHHAVSFRMSEASNPTFNWDAMLPYDFYGLRDAVDIWEPEAYGRIGDWERVKPGAFTASYARLCDPTKPIMWAEMGYTVWDKQRMEPSSKTLDFMAQYASDFYRMMRQGGFDGVFFWWYPGGYRLNEQSDFGIMNPDGTDRPMTRVIRREGPKFLAAKKPPQPNYFIEIDRDADARGFYSIYESSKTTYWNAYARGMTPGLKWKHQPGGK